MDRIRVKMQRPSCCAAGFLMVLFTALSSVFADIPELRRDIFENCEKAEERFSTLSENDKKEMMPYIKLVLDLSPGEAAPAMQNPPAISGLQNPIIGRANRSLGEDLVRAVEPKRELAAKRCAMRLIEKSGAVAFELLPGLIRLSLDKAQPFDFIEQLDDAVWKTALLVSRQNDCSPVEAQIERLLELLGEAGSSSLPGNVLIQTGSCSAVFLIERLKTADENLSRRIKNLLLSIDDSGTNIGPRLLAFLDDKNPVLRLKALEVLSELRPYYLHSLMPMLHLLETSEAELKSRVLKILERVFKEDKLLAEHAQREKILEILFVQLEKLPDPEREIIQLGLAQFKNLSRFWRERLERLAQASDAALRKRAVFLLGQLQDGSGLSFLMRRVLAETDSNVELAAIEVLGNGVGQASKVITTFAQVLKKKDLLRAEAGLRQRRTCAVANSMEKMRGKKAGVLSSKAISPFLPYYIESLRDHSGVEDSAKCQGVKKLLAAYPVVSFPELLKLLKDKDKEIQQRALDVIASMPGKQEKAFSALIELLSTADRNLIEAAQAVLGSYGAGVQPKLKSALKTASATTKKMAIAEALLLTGYKGPEVRDILAKVLSQGDCNMQSYFFLDLIRVDKTLAQDLNNMMISCLAGGSLAKEQEIKVISSLSNPGKATKGEQELRSFMHRQQMDPVLRLALIKRGLELGFTEREIAVWGARILKQVEDPLKIDLLLLFNSMKAEALELIPAIESLIYESKNAQVVTQAIATLFFLQSTSFNYSRFILNESGTNRRDLLQAALSQAPASFVMPLLLELLRQDDLSIRRQALQLISVIPNQGDMAVSELLKFLSVPHDPEERYLAARALFRVRPDAEAAHAALTKEIRGRYRERLLGESFHEREKAELAKIAVNPSSFLEQQTIKVLLD